MLWRNLPLVVSEVVMVALKVVRAVELVLVTQSE